MFNEARQILSIEVSIENYGNQFFRSDFWPYLTCMYRVFFLTTLDIYKAYFKGRYIGRTLAESDRVPYFLYKKLLRLLRLRIL